VVKAYEPSLGARIRERIQEAGLAGIRQADQAGIGVRLSSTLKSAFRRPFPGVRLHGNDVGRGLEVLVAEPAASAVEDLGDLAVFRRARRRGGLDIGDDGAYGQVYVAILTGAPLQCSDSGQHRRRARRSASRPYAAP